MTKTFDEVIAGVRTAKKGVEVREDLAQMGEYCKQFTEEAGQKANAARDEAKGYAANAKASEKKATDAVAGIEQTKTDAVQAVQNAQTTATNAVQKAQSTATTAVTTKQTEAVQAVGAAQTGAVKAVDDERDAALQQVESSTETAKGYAESAASAANAAGNAATAAGGYASNAESSATAASGSASAAAASESNAATSAQSAGTDADRAEAAAELAGTRANTDKTLKTENAPADAKATGEALDKKADGITVHSMTIPTDGWKTDSTVAEYPYYLDISADGVLSTTVVSVSIDPESAAVARDAMLTNPLTGDGFIRMRAHSIPTASITAQWYPVKYGGQFYGDGSIYSNFLLAAHPVGSIYQSSSLVNPADLFGGGTWERIKDRFLLAAGDSYAEGSTGGEAAHTLTANEMPKHSHNVSNGTALLTTNNSIAINQTAAANGLPNITSTAWFAENGGSAAHNNMPPYLVVYTWMRTA
nr:MAG TPA: baseplate protein [Caudoviricetes sp.]